MSNSHVIDVTDATFPTAVLEESRKRPVIVDFWAPWCGPCRALSPVLERCAAQGQGRFLVAKVNTDDNPRFASEFGVRGIPAVFAVVDGEVKDAFTGALPEPEVRAFLERVAPDPVAAAAAEGLALLAARKNDEAAARFQTVARMDPQDPRALVGLAVVAARAGRHDEARNLLNQVGTMPEALKPLATEVRTLADAAGGDLEDARAAIEASPGDVDAILRLATLLFAAGDVPAAFDALLEGVARVKGPRRDDLRKRMVELFDVVGSRTPVVEDARTRLSRLWFS